MIKVDVISGFLGAGKTTLIKKLLSANRGDEQVVLIENEFGEIGVDGAFLKESGVEIKEINSGCICCSLVGDFSASMKEIVEKFSPDRIIIEPSGVGKLSDIIGAIEKIGDLKLNIIATVIDGGKAKMYHKNFGEFYNDQVEEANTVVVSKTENISEEKLLAAVEIVKELNPDATIITTPISELDAEKLLETLENKSDLAAELAAELSEKAKKHALLHHHHDEHEHCHCHDDDDDDEHEHHHEHHDDDDDDDDEHEHHHEHHHHDDDDDDEHEHHHEHHHGHHHADDVFTSWGKEAPVAYTREELEEILKTLCDENAGLGIILRAKGIVEAKDDGKWYYFDLVAGDYEIRLGEPDYTGRLCVIGSKIDEEKIERLFF